MPEHSGVCGGCAERGCVPPSWAGCCVESPTTNHPPTLSGSWHPHPRGHTTRPGPWHPPPRGHTTPPPILSRITHLPGVIAPTTNQPLTHPPWAIMFTSQE